ncbi:hypothetical protein CRUP_037386, partial [Coryphaenoides rupestris]
MPNTRAMYGGQRCGNGYLEDGEECDCGNQEARQSDHMESCPANFYLVDGTRCSGGRGYCYTGMCLSLEQQCRSLWGA